MTAHHVSLRQSAEGRSGKGKEGGGRNLSLYCRIKKARAPSENEVSLWKVQTVGLFPAELQKAKAEGKKCHAKTV